MWKQEYFVVLCSLRREFFRNLLNFYAVCLIVVDTHRSVIAKLEEKIRRTLAHKGPLKARDLKKAVNANRTGLWAFDRAIQNLSAAQEVRQVTSGVWELVPSLAPSTSQHLASPHVS